MVEQGRSRTAFTVQFVDVNAGGGLTNAHAHQRTAHHGGHYLLLEELEDLRHILLFLWLQPLVGRNGQQHQHLSQWHAPLQTEVLGPLVHCRHAGAGEAANALIDTTVQLQT
ncbi:hypothetical protein D3C75_654610 [compost metagenome]